MRFYKSVRHKDLITALSLFFILLLSLPVQLTRADSDATHNASNINTLEKNTLPISQLFPKNTRIGDKQTDLPVYPVYQLDQLLGYAWLSDEINNLAGFSGRPIRLLIGLQANGTLSKVIVIEHHEPVFLHGLGNGALDQFVAQYSGHPIKQQVIVSSAQKNKATSGAAGAVFFDGVTKATISVLIVNDVVLSTALQVARDKLEGFSLPAQSALLEKNVEVMDWPALVSSGLVHQWSVSSDEVFSTLGRHYSDYLHLFDSSDEQYAFTELYYAYLNDPDVGVSLLGEPAYAELMADLPTGDHLIWIGSNGLYRHIPDDFMPGTVPARISLSQGSLNTEIKDTNTSPELKKIIAKKAPEFSESSIFRIKGISNFNLGGETEITLNINLARNHLITDSLTLTDHYQLPSSHWTAIEVKQQTATPLWIRIWLDRIPQILILTISLIILLTVFMRQEKLSRNALRMHQFRWGYLWFTVLFTGYYAQGQLSVVNIFTLLHAIKNGFDITIFLLDPVIFILWIVTFVSLFIWGRGLFCGWLCPFGALQEMASWCGKKLGIKQIRISENKHRKLIYLKYPILIGLVAVSFYELSLAERLAEVEPFKTSITLVFVRHWPFVLYALALLVGGMFIHKFYCRYLCALGAGLAILGALRRFEWLKRIPFCGSPCQTCHHRCEIKAIKRDGQIDYNECVQCLECIVILNSEDQCADTLLKRKKKNLINSVSV